MIFGKPVADLRVGIAGLGTVGAGVCRILADHADLIDSRTGRRIVVTAVAARDKSKDRGVDLSSVDWVAAPQDLITHEAVDVIVEAMGGEGEPALSLVRGALEAGKPVVTANKALLSAHGARLASLAEETGTPLLFEAAVAGGIPIIKMIREGLAANHISALYGILNGTCNYILTTMEQTGESFASVLTQAQELGYAEADPALDVGGGDSGHKLSILTALAFGCWPDYASMSVAGITHISADDIASAAEFGARIKLVAQARQLEDGRILQMVGPCLVKKSMPLAHVNGVLNGVALEGDFVGSSFISGRGAGSGPTASAVVADLMDLAVGLARPVFGVPASAIAQTVFASGDDWTGPYYMRVVVYDKPGVIAEISPVLRDFGISIESLIQRGRSVDQPVQIVIVTHDTKGRAMREASTKIAALGSVIGEPLVMPIICQ